MLLPARAEVDRQLRRYRDRERTMLAFPADRAARAVFEDAGHTLCVLMGKRCAREAADAAEQYLAGPVTPARERDERPRTAVRKAPVADRRAPAGSAVPSGAA